MKWNIFAIMVFPFFVNSCASVSVIKTVAGQNQRNATALQTNLSRYFDDTDVLVTSSIEMKLAQIYDDIIKGVQEETKSAIKKTDQTAYFQLEAGALTQIFNSLGPEAKELEKKRYLRIQPLAAAVAFEGLEPALAATTAQKFETIRNLNITSDKKRTLYEQEVRNLTYVVQHEQAKKEIIEAIRQLQGTLQEQANISTMIADQLMQASQARGEAGAFLKGVTENPQVLETIAQVVAARTKDTEKKAAAEALLKSLKNETSNTESASYE